MSELDMQLIGSGDGAHEGATKRQRSTIAFPYTDYESAEEVARAIHGNVGHGICSAATQLAPWMKQSGRSSSFRAQLAAARLFGLIESDNAESYRLTQLGIRVLDPVQAKEARAEAFLKVPLFCKLYEKYSGGVVPPNAALEREVVALGVAEKQKARARQVFESSAQQTGYREQGANRLVPPAVVVLPPPQAEAADRRVDDRGGGSDVGLVLDQLLIALLQKIPQEGQPWPAEKRLRWFRTFAMNVSQVYDEENDPVELTICLQKGGAPSAT